MTLTEAYNTIAEQHSTFRMLHNMRFFSGTKEFRVRYMGGFSAYFAIDYREQGKTRWNYFKGFSAHHMANGTMVMAHIRGLIKEA